MGSQFAIGTCPTGPMEMFHRNSTTQVLAIQTFQRTHRQSCGPVYVCPPEYFTGPIRTFQPFRLFRRSLNCVYIFVCSAARQWKHHPWRQGRGLLQVPVGNDLWLQVEPQGSRHCVQTAWLPVCFPCLVGCSLWPRVITNHPQPRWMQWGRIQFSRVQSWSMVSSSSLHTWPRCWSDLWNINPFNW